MPRSAAAEENLLAEMLEDFARLSGEELGDILAEGFAEEEPETPEMPEGFEVYGVYEEPGEHEEMDMEIDVDYDDYFDGYFDEQDVDDTLLDAYGEM